MELDFEPKNQSSKSWLILLIVGILGLFSGVIMFLIPFIVPKEALPDLTFPTIPSNNNSEKYYSKLTGLELSNASAITAPTYCIQTPNGTDGARPQVGMDQAGVVFEAIAESGITRFASIYQDPTSAVIGPIRSLRLYYLQWDTPFDCTIVHAGGADDAIAAVRAGGYKDLSENYVYMYRGNYPNYDRLWNNLFTTSAYLKQFSTDYGYTTSNINGFSRMTPEQSKKNRIDETVTEKLVITQPTTANTSELKAKVNYIGVRFGNFATFNIEYTYNATTNSYDRNYEIGPHEVYECPNEDLGEVTPENVCTLKQMSPSVVVTMMVNESLASDGYHEDITTVGSGEAYVFQNGIAIHGSWNKASVDDQIRFYDDSGVEILLAPGQTFIEAVPTYGSVEY